MQLRKPWRVKSGFSRTCIPTGRSRVGTFLMMELTSVWNSKTVHLMVMKEANLPQILPPPKAGEGVRNQLTQSSTEQPGAVLLQKVWSASLMQSWIQKNAAWDSCSVCSSFQKQLWKSDFRCQFRYRQVKVKINSNNSKLPFYPRNPSLFISQ